MAEWARAGWHDTLASVVDGLDTDDRGMTFESGGVSHHRSNRALRQDVLAVARGLIGGGIDRGRRVMLVLPDGEAFVLAFLGTIRAGAVPVPMFPPLPGTDRTGYLGRLAAVARQCDAALLVTAEGLLPWFAGSDDLPPCTTVAEVADPAGGGDLPRLHPDDAALVQYTSGSTSDPKGVVVSHRALLANAGAIADVLAVDPERDRGVSWLPLYHDMGLIGFVVVPLLTRSAVWFLSPLDFVRRPVRWLQLLSEVGGTISFAPNFAYALACRRTTDDELHALDLSSWRVAGCGAEPIRLPVLQAFAERFAPAGFGTERFLPCYGLAEATLAVTLRPPGGPLASLAVVAEDLRRRGVAVPVPGPTRADPLHLVACGPPIPGHEVRVAGADGTPLPDGVQGEILVRGPCVAREMVTDAGTEPLTGTDGWLHTGDLGVVHGGQLYPTGRAREVIVVRGRNLHPQDVEWAVAAEPGVRPGGIVAFGVEGSDGEELVVVVEVAGDGGGVPAAALRSAVRRRASAALGVEPAAVLPVPRGTIPRTTSGKVRRCEMRARYLADALPPSGGR